ncbi:MAG: hypothetical protein ACLQUZ_01540 [Rhizomicrobium sp.]
MSPAALPPVLEVYYAPGCAPCRLELPAVAEFARRDGSRVRIVIISDEARARVDLDKVSPALAATAVAQTRSTPQAALRAAGDSDGILPYARSLAANGTTCARWRGGLTLARARALVSACAGAFILPSSHRS